MGSEIVYLDILEEGNYNSSELHAFQRKYSDYELIDNYRSQLSELYDVLHPEAVGDKKARQSFIDSRADESGGSWVAYPWMKKLVRILPKPDFFLVRTNRNRNLLSSSEIQRLRSTCVGVAGLSVGGSIAHGLNIGAICGRLLLADNDNFNLSNMNRVSISVMDIGEAKLKVTARQIYEVNPYASLSLFPDGLSEENINSFFSEKPAVVFDEMDDFEMKVRLRLAAKRNQTALIMLTNLGDNVLIDVERYDTGDARPFHGTADDIIQDILDGKLSDVDKKRYAAKLVGIENIPTAGLQSLTQIGKTLIGRPQLFGSISISAGLAAFVVRMIVLDDSPPSGRYFLSLRETFGLERADLTMDEQRSSILSGEMNEKL